MRKYIDNDKLSISEQEAYNGRLLSLSEDDVLVNELNKIAVDSENRLVRTTKTLEEVAFWRGSLHAIELLEKRLRCTKPSVTVDGEPVG